jgi:glycosyltransferase involved in cell wall biosynthesis
MARVFVFIPAFNAARFIKAAIESVFAQTYQDWELLVIDDCSTDQTFERAQTFMAHRRVKVIKNEANLGMLENWNKGISLCSHEFWVKLDADDIWQEAFLEESIKVMDERPNVAMVFTRYININEHSDIVKGSEFELPNFAREREFDCVNLVQSGPDEMLKYPILRQGLSLIRRNVFNRIGGYRYLLTRKTLASTDTEFYFRVGCHYKIFCIDSPLYQYRIHSSSISQRDIRSDLGAQKIYEIKTSIIRYYAEKRQISRMMKIRFLRKVRFDYDKFLVYNYRMNGKLGQLILLLLKMLIFYPWQSLSFYSSRIFKQ